jgi:two-component system, NtrC family, response regulator PilR
MHDILVIDDDAVFLDTLSEAMTRGHRDINIKTAMTAEQGLRLLGRRRFDAVISDFRMPGLKGIDLLKECAMACPDTPVIVLTGYGSEALERDALKHGAYTLLQKPVDSDVIYSAVTRAILRSHMLQRSVPSAFTQPDMHLRELVNHRERLSARLKVIAQRLDDALGTDRPF